MDLEVAAVIVLFVILATPFLVLSYRASRPMRDTLRELGTRTGLVLKHPMPGLGYWQLTGVYRGYSVRVRYRHVNRPTLLPHLYLQVPRLSGTELWWRVERCVPKEHLDPSGFKVGYSSRYKVLITRPSAWSSTLCLIRRHPTKIPKTLHRDLDKLCDLADAVLAEEPYKMVFAEEPYNGTSHREDQSYLVRALFAFIFGVAIPIGGIIACIVWLRSAKRDRENGIETSYVGCLWAVLGLLTLLILIFGVFLALVLFPWSQ